MTKPFPTLPAFDDVIAFNKANLEALVEANKVLTAGLQQIAKEVVALGQATLETATATAQKSMKVKTVKDAVDLHVGTAKASYEKLIADSAKLNEISVKVTTEALAPVTARVTEAVTKLTKIAA